MKDDEQIPSKDELNEITQADIDKAFADSRVFDNVDAIIIPIPTRSFEVGEEVRLGNLDDVIIMEVLEGGKAYRTEYTRSDREKRGRGRVYTRMTKIDWWFDLKKLKCANTDAPELFAEYLPGQISSSDIRSLLHKMSHNGIVCDPRYQRGYVWTLEDQVALIDAIFNRISIGSFVFSRHAGYIHDGSDEKVQYINLDGDEVEIPRRRDYTNAVIDGQQRMTTIWRFFTDQFKYKGHYYSELHPQDKFSFTGASVSFRIFDEEDVPYEKVLEMFLMVNRGVPQDSSHLDAVEAQLESLKK